MNKYAHLTCPVCRAKLFEDDEIVVCPECGAPHHKSCYMGLGRCAFADTHGTTEQWQMPEMPEDEKNEAEEKPPVHNNERRFGDKFAPNPNFIVIDPDNEDEAEVERSVIEQAKMIDGVDDNIKIGGESTRDVALFVGFNASRYLRVFKSMELGGAKTGWNWIAFFFPQYWLFSRKCYVYGILVAAFDLLSAVMVSIMQGETAVLSEQLRAVMSAPDTLINNPLVISFLALAAIELIIRLFFGLFGDRIYKHFALKKIKEVKNDEEGYSAVKIMKTGGVNIFAIPISYIAVNSLAFAISSIIMSLI